MSGDGFQEGEVLWIDPGVHPVPELPDGFAFLVQDLLGWGDPGRAVWVRGAVIDGRGTPVRSLTLCVPTNQPRAVRARREPAHTPMDTAGRAAADPAGDRNGDERGLVGPPPGYARRVYR
jgi:hypothetical protein